MNTDHALTLQGFCSGFNQAWLHDNYSSQWGSAYDPKEAERILALAQENQARVVRMWLFEGTETTGISWANNGAPCTISDDFLKHVEDFCQRAQAYDIKVYWTFFDANIAKWCKPPLKTNWLALLRNDNGLALRFIDEVVTPLLEIWKRYPANLFGLDLVNEISLWVEKGWFDADWASANQFVSLWKSRIQQHLDIPVTASFGLSDEHSAIYYLKKRVLHDSVDYHDIHLYNPLGRIWNAFNFLTSWQLKRFSKPIYLGEFGPSQVFREYSDSNQELITRGFLRNGKRVGLKGAFAWRLCDPRVNQPEQLRFSYENPPGTPRPALGTFKQWAEKLQS